MPLHLRSLALLLFIFGASAALAAYVEMKYEDVTPQHAVQFREPTPERAIQSTKPVAPLSHSASDGPIFIESDGVYSPSDGKHADTKARLPSAFERKPPTDAWRAAGSNAGEARNFWIKRRPSSEMQYASLLERISLIRCSRLHLSTCKRATPSL